MYGFEKDIAFVPEIFDVPNNRVKWLWRLFFGRVEDIHYVFTGRIWAVFLVTLIGKLRRKKIIWRIGGQNLYKGLYTSSRIERWLTAYCVRNVTAVVGVNKEICDLAVQWGVSKERVYHIPGFIPPNTNGKHIPKEVYDFFSGKSKKLITCGEVTQYGTYDTYGIWDLLDVFEKLQDVFPDTGLVIYAYEMDPRGPKAVEQFRSVIQSKGLQDSVFIYESTVELWPALSISDIYIRNSTKDGDANSIREALSLGVPVVASDCAPRPEPTITYETGNTDALFEALYTCINNYDYYKRVTEDSGIEDNSKKIISLIENLIEHNE